VKIELVVPKKKFLDERPLQDSMIEKLSKLHLPMSAEVSELLSVLRAVFIKCSAAVNFCMHVLRFRETCISPVDCQSTFVYSLVGSKIDLMCS
jgi:hypothetical protein